MTVNKNYSLFAVLTALTAVLFLFFAGCKTVQEVQPEPEPEPVPAPAPAPPPVHRSVVVFNTTSNPTTGFDWEIWIDYDSTGRFALSNLQREEIYPGALGSPQRQAYTLRSTESGRVFVHFIHKRQWEGGEEIGRYIYTFDIAEDLTIKLLDTQRTLKRGYREEMLPVIETPEIRN